MDELYELWKWSFDPKRFRRAMSLGCHAAGMTENEFVVNSLKMSGVTRWRWYRGKTKPSYATCVEIAGRLGIPFRALVGEDDLEIVKGKNGEIKKLRGVIRQ